MRLLSKSNDSSDWDMSSFGDLQRSPDRLIAIFGGSDNATNEAAQIDLTLIDRSNLVGDVLQRWLLPFGPRPDRRNVAHERSSAAP